MQESQKEFMVAGGLENIGQFSRVEVDSANRTKVPFIYDFSFGNYLAQKTFFSELSRVQTALIGDKKFKLPNGQTLDLETTGGLLALNIFVETLNATKDAMTGLSQLGLNNEKKLWQLQ